MTVTALSGMCFFPLFLAQGKSQIVGHVLISPLQLYSTLGLDFIYMKSKGDLVSSQEPRSF